MRTFSFLLMVLVFATSHAQEKNAFGKWRDYRDSGSFVSTSKSDHIEYTDKRRVIIDTTDEGRQEMNAHLEEYKTGKRKLDPQYIMKYQSSIYEFKKLENKFVLTTINNGSEINNYFKYDPNTKMYLGNIAKQKIMLFYSENEDILYMLFLQPKNTFRTFKLIRD